jgi:hypothetical protein
MADGLEQRLKTALAGRKTIEMGQFQMLNLDMVKAETGDQWIALRKKIYNVAVHFIEKRLHPDDVLVRCRGGFILVFAHFTGNEAKERVAQLSRELNLFFLGDQILKHLEIRAEARTVTASELAQVVASANRAAPNHSVAGGRRKSDQAGEAKPGGAGWKDGDGEAQERSAGWKDGEASAKPSGQWSADDAATFGPGSPGWVGSDEEADANAKAQPSWQENQTDARRGSTSPSGVPGGPVKSVVEPQRADWRGQTAQADDAASVDPKRDGPGQSSKTKSPVTAKTRGAATAGSAASEGKQAGRQKGPDGAAAKAAKSAPAAGASKGKPSKKAAARDIPAMPQAVFTESGPHWDDLIFKPCWDAKNAAITTYFCLPRRVSSNGEVRYGRDVLPPSAALDLHRALDRSVAITAQRGFQQIYSEGGACAIAIPVHYNTIQAVTDRVSYFSILQSVPQHLRRFFFLRVDGIPKGAPVSQMEELFRSMKCFGSNILAKVDFGLADFNAFENCGIDLFGSEVPRRLNDGHIDEAALMRMAEMVQSSRKIRSEVFLTQVANFDLLNAAVTAGVRYFAGTAIGDEVALPTSIRPLSFADLQARSRRRAA